MFKLYSIFLEIRRLYAPAVSAYIGLDNFKSKRNYLKTYLYIA